LEVYFLIGRKFFALFLMVILGVSSLSIANAQLVNEQTFSPILVSENQSYDLQLDLNKQSEPTIVTDYKLSLSENLAFNTEDSSRSTPDVSQETLQIERKISMKERLAIHSGGIDSGILLTIKDNLDRKAMLERIFAQERIRLEKSIISNYLGNEKIDEQTEIISINQNNIFPGISQIVSGLPLDEFSILLKNEIDHILKQINSLDFSEYNFVDVENPSLLLLLVPLSSIIIIHSEKSSIKFYQIKQFTCLVFIIILISHHVLYHSNLFCILFFYLSLFLHMLLPKMKMKLNKELLLLMKLKL